MPLLILLPIINRIFEEYKRTSAGGMSRLMDIELLIPVTETSDNACFFKGLHYIDIFFDDYLAGIPVTLSVRVFTSGHGGCEARFEFQTGLDQPDYAYWEFRDYIKELGKGEYVGNFTMNVNDAVDDPASLCLRYEYSIPVPDNGNIPGDMIECIVTRLFIDLHHAAQQFFQLFFYHLPAYLHMSKYSVASGEKRPESANVSRVIPFPINRRNRTRT